MLKQISSYNLPEPFVAGRLPEGALTANQTMRFIQSHRALAEELVRQRLGRPRPLPPEQGGLPFSDCTPESLDREAWNHCSLKSYLQPTLGENAPEAVSALTRILKAIVRHLTGRLDYTLTSEAFDFWAQAAGDVPRWQVMLALTIVRLAGFWKIITPDRQTLSARLARLARRVQ